MLPVLSIGPVSLPVAPLVTIASFWIGLGVAARAGRRFGLNEDVLFNAGFYSVLGGLLGARVWYVVEYWAYYRDRFGEVFALNLNTLAPFEGIVIGLIVAIVYLQRKQMPGAATLDALAPGLAAFAAGLSLANLASGAAFGEVANLPWAIELWDARRHPTQVYDLVLSLGILVVTLRLLNAGSPPGRTFGIFVALFSASRLLTEGFRGDSALLSGGWRSMQFVWLGVLLIALIGLAWLDTRRSAAKRSADSGEDNI